MKKGEKNTGFIFLREPKVRHNGETS